ncbi:GDP-mannose 4,6-dehydratase, partial [Escherichia coli]
MSILVTGGAGYIGSHAILTLLQNGYDVISLDNYCNSSPKSLERVEEICLSKIKKLRGDIRDRHILKNIFSKYNVSTVMHFAGLKSVNESIKKP